MSLLHLNLSRRPFRNRRPVVRLAVLLWILALGLVALNGWLYRGYFLGTGEKARRLAEIEATLALQVEEIRAGREQVATLNLQHQNATVEFLNRKIERRSLAWSRLFDQLASLLPRDVRLLSLAPEASKERKTSSSRQETGPRSVRLKINGEAKNDEALLALVDALFDHPAFRNPDLEREAQADNGFVNFDLTTEYLPDGGPQPPSPAAETSP